MKLTTHRHLMLRSRIRLHGVVLGWTQGQLYLYHPAQRPTPYTPVTRSCLTFLLSVSGLHVPSVGRMELWWALGGRHHHWSYDIHTHVRNFKMLSINCKINGRDALCLTKHHSTKTCRSGGKAPRFLSLGTRSWWVVSFTTLPIYPGTNWIWG